MPIILGRAFLAIVGAVGDIFKGIISFANIDENVLKFVPQNRGMHLDSYVGVTDVSFPLVVSQKDLSDKHNVKESMISASNNSGGKGK